jgi:SAM-dependent methyltransferase
MNLLREGFKRLFEHAYALNAGNILELVGGGSYQSICDLGCHDGSWTVEVINRARPERTFGIEIVEASAMEARSRGIRVLIADLSRPFPLGDAMLDLVHANQVIEHVADIDRFLSEIRRVLRVGGTAIISTENASSWHNIAASVLGWQMFSLTNVSSRASGLGNPLAIHRHIEPKLASWTHKTVFSYRGLLEVMKLHDLRPVRVLGAGYYPLPARLGRLDTRHAHFLTVKAKRVER